MHKNHAELIAKRFGEEVDFLVKQGNRILVIFRQIKSLKKAKATA